MSFLPTFVAKVSTCFKLFPSKNWLLRKAWEEIVAGFLPPRHWEAVNTSIYNNHPLFLDKLSNRSIAFWELQAFDRFFPPAPARVLVTAAGGGREVNELLERGYTVCAFEPAPRLAQACEEIAASDSRFKFMKLSYDQFMHSSDSFFEGVFDAVVVGWGSFTHIPSIDSMVVVLAKLRKLCPDGPMLLSWATELGYGARRRAFARLLRLMGGKAYRQGNFFDLQYGICRCLSTEEVRQLCASQENHLSILAIYNHTGTGVVLPVRKQP